MRLPGQRVGATSDNNGLAAFGPARSFDGEKSRPHAENFTAVSLLRRGRYSFYSPEGATAAGLGPNGQVDGQTVGRRNVKW
jgi:hypothetical protein